MAFFEGPVGWGGYPPELAWWTGGRPRALVAGEGWGGAVGAMANFATCVVFLSFLTRTKRRKMAFFEGCPVGWGGVPTGAGLVDGGVDQGEGVREGLAWRGKAGWVPTGARGGCKGFVRIFVVSNVYKKKKNGFF